VVMYVMLFGYPPFYVDPKKYGSMEHEMIYEQIKKGFKNQVIPGYGAWFPDPQQAPHLPSSEAVRDLIGKLLSLDPEKRPTALEALDHDWLNGGHNKQPLPNTVLQSVKNFTKGCSFSTAVCITLMSCLRTDEYAACDTAFKKMDKNGDGSITFEEFSEAMTKSTNLSKKELRRQFAQCDINGDEVIRYKELVTAMTHEHLLANDERLRKAFSRLDVDGDNYIDSKDLELIMKSEQMDMPESHFAKFIESADKDGDGRIDFDEFLIALAPQLYEEKHEAKEEEVAVLEEKEPLPPKVKVKVTKGLSKSKSNLKENIVLDNYFS